MPGQTPRPSLDMMTCVASETCRNQKLRCLLEPDDAQDSCSNCNGLNGERKCCSDTLQNPEEPNGHAAKTRFVCQGHEDTLLAQAEVETSDIQSVVPAVLEPAKSKVQRDDDTPTLLREQEESGNGPADALVYWCCNCGFSPMLVELCPKCILCNHVRCDNCRVESSG